MKIVAVIIDGSLPQDEINEIHKVIEQNNIPEICIGELERIKPDLIFVCNYMRIIKSELINKYIFINIHAGILPRWRGLNANCWAILNGENEVGYSIHRIREEMDAGEIYKVIKVKLLPNETYASARSRIHEILCSELDDILEKIVFGALPPIKQESSSLVYNSSLKKNDGDIKDWNKPSAWINGLFRVFGLPPYGTGTRLCIKGNAYTIKEMEIADKIATSLGIPGMVLNRYGDGSVLIKTQDTAVRIIKLFNDEGEDLTPSKVLKIGMRL